MSGGPARLGAGPFANSALVGNATCILPDSPEMPEQPKSLTYAQYTLGLTTIKNLSGEDPITIEFKNDRRIRSLIWPGTVWWDSNYPISKVIPAREDAHSWRGRIIPIPMTVEIDEDRQIRGVHERETQERGQFSICAPPRQCACVRADTLIDNRFYSVFRSL